MSYTVLARKWRPKKFAELVGQAHVMQALSNALDQQRLHHAYLFTGTRGVGKTTIARIFAKALNCEQGISSTPCGVCDVCRSIDEGRFIDLIEVDAASRTKVDDTREILDNVQFAPTQGRYKVYLIDEVHMLSKSSFNALLKTLEEPPEHVKFLLATTDPHKLPITVLSRCLQFNLMRLTQIQIQNHLEFIMSQESLPCDKTALALIAKGADGSARDALSLLDQAIAYGAGEVLFEPVQTMLGLVDQQYGLSILNALAQDDPDQLKGAIQQLAIMGVDYQALLTQLIETLHALSYFQVFGDSADGIGLPNDILNGLAEQLSPERVQLFYQIALLAKQDMQLAPDIRIGFEMTLIRMLAFQPASGAVCNAESTSSSSDVSPSKVSTLSQPVASLSEAQNALASLASARSLVGKKNEGIATNPQSEGVNHVPQAPLNSQIPASGMAVQPNVETVYNEAPTSQGNALGDSGELPHFDVPANTAGNTENLGADTGIESGFEPKVETNFSGASMENTPPWDMSEPSNAQSQVSSQPDYGVSESAPMAEPAPIISSSDHLAQIKARLKQPLGKPDSLSQPSVVKPPVQPIEVIELPVERLKHSALEPMFNEVEPRVAADANAFASKDEESALELNVEPKAEPKLESQKTASEPLVRNANFESPSNDVGIERWLEIIDQLALKGMAGEVARNSVLVDFSETRMAVSIDPEQNYSKQEMALIQFSEAVKQRFGDDYQLEFVSTNEHLTPVKHAKQLAENKQQQAEQSIEQDAIVQAISQQLGVEIMQGTIKPI